MMMVQAGVFVAIILCMQAVMGQVNRPNGCVCYSNGGNTPRTPCSTPGCSLGGNQNCGGDISLFLYYPNPQDASADGLTPSTVNRRFGSCSCPAGAYNRYSSAKNNAYYDNGPDTPNRYFNISTCADFGNIPANNPVVYLNAGASRNNVIDCCRACCETGGD